MIWNLLYSFSVYIFSSYLVIPSIFCKVQHFQIVSIQRIWMSFIWQTILELANLINYLWFTFSLGVVLPSDHIYTARVPAQLWWWRAWSKKSSPRGVWWGLLERSSRLCHTRRTGYESRLLFLVHVLSFLHYSAKRQMYVVDQVKILSHCAALF